MSIQYKGLDEQQVIDSRSRYGANVLTPPAKRSLWLQFADKFGDPLIIILLVAGFLSVGISIYEYSMGQGARVFFEPVGIFVAILLATGIGFILEVKADKEFEILNQVNDEEPVQVWRESQLMQVGRRDVVVGDVVVLNTGDEVPADGTLLEASRMQVDESTLTGEPICHKSIVAEEQDAEATFPTNHVLRGTKVMEGHGVMEVSAVGDKTENGKVFVASQIDNSVKTPLSEQLDRLGKMVSYFSYAVAAIIVIGRIFTYFSVMTHANGQDITVSELLEGDNLFHFIAYMLQTVMIAVTLIVVSVPEGLPMAINMSLALSMRRMLKVSNLVRKMHACETMGATTVICTDKTGTLTQNQMRVSDSYLAEGVSLTEAIAVNSTASLDADGNVLGNPTEGALLLWLRDQGIDYHQLRDSVEIVDELPFSTENKYMWTEVRKNNSIIRYIKGAPEIVCPTFLEHAATYQSKGMRTLGFAYEVEGKRTEMGVVAISDPVRPDVPDAVRECMDAGIRVIMVTGDSEKTAKEIGRQIGIPEQDVIFRARPLDKRNLVERLQAEGEVVAVTGDGTNDAPALKAAHVGLSMGSGTSVAKEASDITIIDNSFASIGRAVMWGRSLYQNLQRFILFQMTVNVAACLVVAIGAFMGMESPLSVTQMLWVNLIMDTFAAMALSSLPPSRQVMTEKPRSRQAFIIDRPMAINIIGTGIVFAIVSVLYMMYGDMLHISRGTDGFFFTVFVMMQFWNMFNARAYKTNRSALHLDGCGVFCGIMLMIFIGQVLIVELGGEMFNVEPLSLRQWLIAIVCTSPVLIIGEVARWWTGSAKSHNKLS